MFSLPQYAVLNEFIPCFNLGLLAGSIPIWWWWTESYFINLFMQTLYRCYISLELQFYLFASWNKRQIWTHVQLTFSQRWCFFFIADIHPYFHKKELLNLEK